MANDQARPTMVRTTLLLYIPDSACSCKSDFGNIILGWVRCGTYRLLIESTNPGIVALSSNIFFFLRAIMEYSQFGDTETSASKLKVNKVVSQSSFCFLTQNITIF
jgi:hypothetical protein